MQRRALLRATGACGLATLAGCLESIPTVGETTLGWFAVYNRDQENGHSFDVRIERDGTTIHTSSHQVASYNPEANESSPPSAVVDCTWDNVPGDYLVRVRPDQGEWNGYDIVKNALQPPECVIVYAVFGEYRETESTEPTLSFVLDETNCSEVRTLPGGCPDAVPDDPA